MAVPSVTKTYTYNVNNAVTAGADIQTTYRGFWLAFKNALVAGGWTVRSSSNSTVADTNDNWTSGASLVWANNNNAHSWIVLRHPVCLWDLCVDLQPVNGFFQALIGISRSGYLQTGLVTTARPGLVASPSDEQVLTNATTLLWGNSNQNYVWHYLRSTDGQVQRFIVCVADVPVWVFSMDVPQSPVANWNPTATPPGCTLYLNAASVANGASYTNTYTVTSVFSRMGSGSGTAVPFFLAGASYNTNLLTNGLLVPNDITGEYPLVANTLVSTTASYRGQMALLFDLWFGVSNLTTGTTYPADNSRQFAQFGSLVIPWNGTVPITR